MKRYELLALVLLVSHAFSASVPEAELEEDEPVEGFDLSSDGAFGSQHQTRIQTDDFLLEHNSNFDLDHVFAESRVGPGPFQILVHDLVRTFGNIFWNFFTILLLSRMVKMMTLWLKLSTNVTFPMILFPWVILLSQFPTHLIL